MTLMLALPEEASLTRTGMMRNFQPTPVTPTELLPLAAAQPATCVPWPLMSVKTPPSASGTPLAALKPGTRLPRSWCVTMPVSATATIMVADPVPRSHADALCIMTWCHWSA